MGLRVGAQWRSVGSRREVDRSINEILLERRDAPPKDPADAAAGFIYLLARGFLERECRPERAEQVVRDFEKAARDLTDAAWAGATREEQAKILKKFWKEFALPARDLRKRRKARKPSGAQLLREYEELCPQLKPILRNREVRSISTRIESLKALVPPTEAKALKDAAEEPPWVAARIILGSRHDLKADTVRNRISKARKAR